MMDLLKFILSLLVIVTGFTWLLWIFAGIPIILYAKFFLSSNKINKPFDKYYAIQTKIFIYGLFLGLPSIIMMFFGFWADFSLAKPLSDSLVNSRSTVSQFLFVFTLIYLGILAHRRQSSSIDKIPGQLLSVVVGVFLTLTKLGEWCYLLMYWLIDFSEIWIFALPLFGFWYSLSRGLSGGIFLSLSLFGFVFADEYLFDRIVIPQMVGLVVFLILTILYKNIDLNRLSTPYSQLDVEFTVIERH